MSTGFGGIVWISGDMSEQIVDSNGDYLLIKLSNMQATLLGKTLEEAKEKLYILGRYDIIKELN